MVHQQKAGLVDLLSICLIKGGFSCAFMIWALVWMFFGSLLGIRMRRQINKAVVVLIEDWLLGSGILENCNLVDLDFSGHKFTWLNKRFGGQLIMERLDLAFCNLTWLQIFSMQRLQQAIASQSQSPSSSILTTPRRPDLTSHRHTHPPATILHDHRHLCTTVLCLCSTHAAHHSLVTIINRHPTIQHSSSSLATGHMRILTTTLVVDKSDSDKITL
ncbi:hypothetical protein M9H77_20988 [Catharanthus roseus]|uniref:Uncharacterized protein n=1 Tax=Catharanthus roseus TaxID=4058 RepID=A0ACC0AMR8_CATRO|nr:hypothetical protein M9H77_20988 [Catharanthus roseus]